MATTTPERGRTIGKEWDAPRRAALLKQIVNARSSVEEACSRHGLGVEVVQDWLRGFRRAALVNFDESLKRRLLEQGADPALWAAEFAGTLEEIAVIDWIQSVEVTRKSAVIVVTHDGLESRIWFVDGAIVDAESGRLSGKAALYRIVSIEQGRVWVEFRAERRARTIEASTASLLFEAAHRRDEAARLWSKLGDGRRVYHVTEQATRRAADTSRAEKWLLEYFQQPSSLLQVLQRSELGDVETLQLFVLLSKSQLIAVDPSSPPVATTESEAGELASCRTLPVPRLSGQLAFPRSVVPLWAWGAVAALVLLPLALFLRLQTPTRAPARSVASATPDRGSAAPPAEVPRYVVATAFEPSDAAIWLDGQPLPGAALNSTFPRDGRAHQLRALAPGYASVVVVFVDAPPPELIRLEPVAPPPTDVAATKPARASVRRPRRAPAPESAASPAPIQPDRAAIPMIQVIP